MNENSRCAKDLFLFKHALSDVADSTSKQSAQATSSESERGKVSQKKLTVEGVCPGNAIYWNLLQSQSGSREESWSFHVIGGIIELLVTKVQSRTFCSSEMESAIFRKQL